MSSKLLILAAVSALTVAPVLLADDDDPPGRAARLGLVDGTVSLQPGGVEDWIPAELNRPLTTGDRLWTQDDARAELSIGSALVRLNRRTSASLVNLDDHMAQVEISVGTLVITIRDLTNGEAFEVDTPQLAFTVLRPGKYRIDVNEQGDTTLVTVLNGEGEAMAAGQSYSVLPNERAKVSGDPLAYTKELTPPPDSFDEWCLKRDKRLEASLSAQYVAPDVPGVEDLDDNGIWRANPEYGEMWMPTGVPDDWAPYRSGHWDWIEPWGWTWVDDAAWGYAPFHYGRWAFVSGGWGWIPGPFGGPAIFAPALVAWIGGDGFVFGGDLAVGWVPLAPGELFIPGFHASARYFEVVNARNTVVSRAQIRNGLANHNSRTSYVNEHARGGTTVVPHGVMTGGKPVMKNTVAPSKGTLAFKEYQQHAPVAPHHESVLGGRTATTSRPPVGLTNRTIMTKVTPPAGRPSFQQQESALRAHPGQPVDKTTLAGLHSGTPDSHRIYQNATVKPPPPAPKPAATPTGGNVAGKEQQEHPRPSGYGSITKSPGRPAGATGPAAVPPGSKSASNAPKPEGPPSLAPRQTGGEAPASRPGNGQASNSRGSAPAEEHRQASRPAPAPERRQSATEQRHESAPAPRASAPERHESAPSPRASAQEHHEAAPAPRASAPERHESAPAPRPSAPERHESAPAPRPAPAPAPRPYTPPHH
jgi:hypothetical protein